jgi:phospholipid transport system substrate-binding protein
MRRLFQFVSLIIIPSLTLPAVVVDVAVAADTGTAAAADGPGATAVRKANDTLSALLRQKVAPKSEAEKRLAREISAQLKGFLDVDELGQRALADHWGALSPDKKKQFTALLRGLVEANYVRALRSNLDYEVRYLGEQPQAGVLRVSTELHLRRKDRPEVVAVDYLLRAERGSWRAFDLVTDGVGLVENYRAQFNKVIAKEGVAGLLERMSKKQAQLGS